MEPDSETSEAAADQGRRTFLSRTSTAAMAAGCAASYGTLGSIAGAFLYPARPRKTAWFFVAEVQALALGQSLTYRSPAGETIAITRQAEQGGDDDFLALSSVCPHLGCQVHWEAQNNRFYCPCHNGAFDAQGRATEGPPADANQVLPRFPLRIENGLLFIEVPVEGML